MQLSWRLLAITIVYLAIQFIIEVARSTIARANATSDTAWVYVGAQILHVCAVLVFAMAVAVVGFADIAAAIHAFDSVRFKALSALTIYVGTLFAGGYLVRQVTRPIADHVHRSGAMRDELPNAGLYIGWLERLLILTAVLMQSPSMIGLILTGKSIARFPELKDARFAEYFLIGTFLSVAIALAGGMLIQLTWYGSVQFR